MRQFAIFAVSALLLVLGATDLSAQLNHRQVITAQMSASSQHQAKDGYALDATVLNRGQLVGLLGKGAPLGLELQLVKGSAYVISGACDHDCSDMDLRLLAPDGETVVAQDVEDDDVPVIMFQIAETGTYMLTVLVAECSEPYSYFGLQILKK